MIREQKSGPLISKKNILDSSQGRANILPGGAATSDNQNNLQTLVGEVQASPTANTVLARLKDILTGVSSVITELQTLRSVDANNSTTSTLGNGGTFTGTSCDCVDSTSGIVSIIADQNSATDGLEIQYSSDNTNWDHSHVFTIVANASQGIEFGLEARYIRIVYTNGTTPQGFFRLQTIFSKAPTSVNTHPIEYIISGSHPAQIVRSVLTAKNPGGDYGNINRTEGGNLKVSVEEVEATGLRDFHLELARGNISGMMSVNKFGEAPAGVQTTATDIWDRADATPTQQIWVAPTQARTHTIASTDANDTDAGTGARTVRVWGLTGWAAAEVSEDVTMDTGSPPVTSNSYVIIHRMRVLTSGATSVNIGTITATATTDATVTATIRPSEGTTHMAIYGIPSTQKAYVKRWYGSINKSSGAVGTINFKMMFNPEPNAQLTHFSVRSERGVQSTGTSDIDWHLDVPLELPGPGIIKVQGIASAADIDGSAGFDLVIIDNA